MVGKAFQSLPGQVGEARGQQHHEKQNPTPKLRLFAVQLGRRTVLRRAQERSFTGGELGHGYLVSRPCNVTNVDLLSHRTYSDCPEQPLLLESLVRVALSRME